jgi:hypothetical protein
MKMAEATYMGVGPVIASVGKVAVGCQAARPGVGTKLDQPEGYQGCRQPLAMVALSADERIYIVDRLL